MKLSTGLENFKGVVSDDLSFASVEMTLPWWRDLCHRLSRDQPQPGSFFQRPREAEKRDLGNEVAAMLDFMMSLHCPIVSDKRFSAFQQQRQHSDMKSKMVVCGKFKSRNLFRLLVLLLLNVTFPLSSKICNLRIICSNLASTHTNS